MPGDLARPRARLMRHKEPVPVTREQLQDPESRAALTEAWPADQLRDLVVAPDGHTYIRKSVRRYAKRTRRLPGLREHRVDREDIDRLLIPDRFMRAQLDAADPSVPEDPVTLHGMLDPVIASDGRTYDRATLDRLFRDGRGDARSPFTRAPLGRLAYRHREAGAHIPHPDLSMVRVRDLDTVVREAESAAERRGRLDVLDERLRGGRAALAVIVPAAIGGAVLGALTFGVGVGPGLFLGCVAGSIGAPAAAYQAANGESHSWRGVRGLGRWVGRAAQRARRARRADPLVATLTRNLGEISAVE